MNEYLEMLAREKSKRAYPTHCQNPQNLEKGGFGGFVSDPPRHILKNQPAVSPDPNAYRLWLITQPDGKVISSSFTPPVTLAQVREWYPDADIEPEGEGEGGPLGLSVVHVPEPQPDWLADDRRTCRQCANLTASGRCTTPPPQTIRPYYPCMAKLWRCPEYQPGPEDPDRRPGRERYGSLATRRTPT